VISRTFIAVLLLLLLAGCSSRPSAPVEERTSRSSSYQLTRDGHYRIRRGDTLHAIAFNFGLDWRDLARWNGIRSPDLIYPDQELRLSPPGPGKSSSGRSSGSGKQTGAKTSPAPAKTESGSKSTRKSAPPTASGSDPKKWLWPTQGRIVSSFRANDSARKGIDIGGTAGQDVVASAAGQVVYSGSGLIGYGELIIIKHSERMLSAYAHNRKRVVSEGQQVKAGTKIAEMGTNDRNQAMLHFEIRVNGNPANPMNYLPKR
jgi:lipoprotein NlpD